LKIKRKSYVLIYFHALLLGCITHTPRCTFHNFQTCPICCVRSDKQKKSENNDILCTYIYTGESRKATKFLIKQNKNTPKWQQRGTIQKASRRK